MNPTNTLDPNRQWAARICAQIERDFKLWEFWYNAWEEAQHLTHQQCERRWGCTKEELDTKLYRVEKACLDSPIDPPPF